MKESDSQKMKPGAPMTGNPGHARDFVLDRRMRTLLQARCGYVWLRSLILVRKGGPPNADVRWQTRYRLEGRRGLARWLNAGAVF